MTRKSFTGAQRLKIFLAADGVCHLCSRKIADGEPWEVEHVKALGLSGTNEAANLRPAHVDCHAGKTKKDVAIMRKADRQGKKNIPGGITRPKRKIESRPFPPSGRKKAVWLRSE